MQVASVSGEIKHFAGLDIPSYGHAMFVVRHQLRGAFSMRDRVSDAIAAAAAAVGEVARIRVFHPPARRPRVMRVAKPMVLTGNYRKKLQEYSHCSCDFQMRLCSDWTLFL